LLRNKKLTPNIASSNLDFANILYPIIASYTTAWACGPSSFVILAMLESNELSGEIRQKLLKTLKKEKKELQAAADGKRIEKYGPFKPSPGKENEIESVTKGKLESKKGLKKASVGKEKENKGNQGSRLLLQKL
jgi:pumilio family protein 6